MITRMNDMQIFQQPSQLYHFGIEKTKYTFRVTTVFNRWDIHCFHHYSRAAGEFGES